MKNNILKVKESLISNKFLKSYYDWADRNTDISILPILITVIFVGMTVITRGKFLSIYNLNAMGYQLPELGLFAFAMMITMVTGGINLSIISSANFAGVLMAFLMTRYLSPDAIGFQTNLALTSIIVFGLLFSALLGLINGLLVAYVEVSPVLTTLSTMILYEGFTLAITKGYVISDFPEALLFIGNGRILGLPAPFLVFVIVSFVMWILLQRRPLGRQLFMIGSNSKASAYTGINFKKVIVKSYIISGVLAGIAAVIMMSRFNSANARYGASYVLLSVLISVLGGTDPDGGTAKVLGMIIALFSLQAITSGLNLLEISSFVTVALWGILLALVIAFRHYNVRKRNNRLAKLAERRE